MRIDCLELKAFGLFTDTKIDLSAGSQGLHIVYGPNESGKSTSLRALRQLLYGIPSKSSDDFIHSYQSMRIGGSISLANGSSLSFSRKKGRTKTLRDAETEEVLDDAALERFMHGLKQSHFENMFGIDHADLIRGGRELCTGSGELGQILFSAGAGIADVYGIMDELSSEADALFRPAGSNPSINAAINLLKDAQKEQRDLEIPSTEWQRHDESLSQALKERASIEEHLREEEKSLSRLSRIKDALPLVAKRKELLEELESLKDAILLEEDFGEKAKILQLDLKTAKSEEQRSNAELKNLDDELGKIQLPDGLIEQAAVIEDLLKQLGSHQKALHDRSGLAVRLNQLEEAIGNDLKNLGHPPNAEMVEKLRITVADRRRIRELAAEKTAIDETFRTTSRELVNIKSSIEMLKAKLAAAEKPPDTARMRSALKRIQQRGALESQLSGSSNKFKKDEAQLVADASRLFREYESLRQRIVDQKNWSLLSEIKTPTMDEIGRFNSRIEKKAHAVASWREQLQKEENELQEVEKRLSSSKLQMDVPTEDDLKSARSKRQNGWSVIKRVWLNDSSADGSQDFKDESSEGAGAPEELARAFEHSVDEADRLSDRLRREATSVATKANLVATREKHEKRIEELKQTIETTRQELGKLKEDWNLSWQALGADPKSPKDMSAWLQELGNLARHSDIVRSAKLETEDLSAAIEECKVELTDLLDDLGEKARGQETLSALIERSQILIEKYDSLRAENESLSSDLKRSESQLHSAEHDAREASERLSHWKECWQEALAPLSLDKETTPSQANAVVDTLNQILKNDADAGDLRSRVKGIDRDAREFEKNVQELAEKVARDLLEFPATQAVGELNARLVKARTDKERFLLLSKRLKEEKINLERVSTAIRTCNEKLDALCLESGCSEYGALIEAARNSAKRRGLERDLRDVEQHLLRLSAGATPTEFAEEVLSIDPDTLEPQMGLHRQAISEFSEKRTELDQSIGHERAELKRIDGGGRAAEAAERAQTLIAEIAGQSERYIRLRLARHLLTKGIERYKEESQSPVLKRASDLFAELTLGSFEGLKEDFDDRGSSVLVGVRAGSGALVGLDGMSEGTCDQVYLALRLASLERYLDEHESIPFIIDDILVNFDDLRSAATLRALARLSNRTQIIFFTHHVHLLDLARKSVDSNTLFVHDLEELKGSPQSKRLSEQQEFLSRLLPESANSNVGS